MLAVVRPFSVEYKGSWHPVLYVYEQITGDVTHWGYCIAGDDEAPLFVPSDKVTKIRADLVRG